MSLILKNCRFIDVKTGALISRKDIVIEDGCISSINDTIDSNDAICSDVVDMSGWFMVPGMINVHEHQTYKRVVGSVMGNGLLSSGAGLATVYAVRSALFSLRTGVTTICELGAIGNVAWDMKKAISNGLIPGPRMFISGNPISITGGHAWELSIEADGVDEVRSAVRNLLKKGVDWIKLMASHDPIIGDHEEHTVTELTFEEISVAVEEAHRAYKKVAVHAMGSGTLRKCIEARVDTINHGAYLTRELAEKMADNSVSLVPTLSSYRRTTDPRFRRGAKWISDHEKLIEAFNVAFRHAADSAVNIAVGTDSVGGFVEELEIMNSLGFSELRCLQAATINGAKLLGEERNLGSIEIGKKADLIAVRNNPLQNLNGLREVEIVIKNGVVFAPDSLSLPGINNELIIEDFN